MNSRVIFNGHIYRFDFICQFTRARILTKITESYFSHNRRLKFSHRTKLPHVIKDSRTSLKRNRITIVRNRLDRRSTVLFLPRLGNRVGRMIPIFPMDRNVFRSTRLFTGVFLARRIATVFSSNWRNRGGRSSACPWRPRGSRGWSTRK